MGFLDRLFGRREEPQGQPAAPTYGPSDRSQPPSDADEQALQRYRYMLKTAPPETIEQAHEEAFAKLTPSQRAQVLHELAAVTPEEERTALVEGRDDPKSLAKLATRTEIRQPGVMERVFGGRGMGAGMGGMGAGMGGMGGSIFGSLVAGFVGSMIAEEFFHSMGDTGAGLSDLGTQPEDQQVADSTEDSSGDTSSDASSGYGDDPGGYSDEDLGGDSGSDWGGGDWGGGDWGGGDFGGGDW